MILIFKLLAAPVLIFLLTMVSRRFGPTVGGLLMGIPLVTGPISVFTALEHGAGFATDAAIGNLVGQISTCIFCFAYAGAARRLGCWACAGVGVAAFFAATAVWNEFSWGFAPALGALMAVILLFSALLRPVEVAQIAGAPPVWDIPARMIVSACFVMLITLLTARLGPQLSGLVAPFPVFVLILAVFTHHQRGAGAAANLLRGVIIGSFSFAAFFTVVACALPHIGLVATYGAAALTSVVTSGLVYTVVHWG